jgi:PAS domain-containing protein
VEELENLSRQIKNPRRSFFDATLSNITDLAYAFDLKGRWIYANRPLLDIWNRSFEEIVGRTCTELGYPPELARLLESQIQQVITTKCTVRGRNSLRQRIGQTNDDHEYIFQSGDGCQRKRHRCSSERRDSSLNANID